MLLLNLSTCMVLLKSVDISFTKSILSRDIGGVHYFSPLFLYPHIPAFSFCCILTSLLAQFSDCTLVS